MMKPFIKRQVGRAARLYHRARASHPVRHGILNRRGRALFEEAGRTLSPKQEEVVRELRENGIAVVSIADLLPPEIFEELRAYAEKRWADPAVKERAGQRGDVMVNGKPRSKEYFLVELWEGEHVLDLAHPFLRFSVHDSILQIVNAYLGTFSKFRGWALQATVPVAEGERRYASQEWHRDPEDRRLVKTFLYLSDVGPENGPFIYLPRTQEGGKWRHLFPQDPPRGSKVKEEGLPMNEVRTCLGKAGTFILADTSGIHRGGYATEGKRLMYTSIYATPASPWPIVYRYGPRIPTDLSPEAAFALDNDPRQKEPRFYKM